MLQYHILRVISGALYVYTILCFIRIIFTWFPQAQYSMPGRILSTLCDPYLNFFRRFRILRIGMLDLSPALAMGVLITITFIITGLISSSQITLGFILGQFFLAIWQLVSSILLLIIIILIVRLAVLLFSNPYAPESPIWSALDTSFTPFIYRVANIFTGSNRVPFKTALIICTVVLIVIDIAFSKFLVPFTASLLFSIPV